MSALRTSRLARYLTLAYLALVVHASLYPFAGWRDSGVSPFAFLGGGWPRYWTGFDLAANVGAYLPLGFLLALAVGDRKRRWIAVAAAVVAAALVSLTLETIQNWLPTRVPSNVDVACNTAGGLLGALLAYNRGTQLLRHLVAIEQGLVASLPRAEIGITLIGLWLLAQLSPETILFGTGDLRRLFGEFDAIPYSAEQLLTLEAAVTACNTLAVGLLVRQLLAGRLLALSPLFLFFVFALALRALSAALVLGPAEAFDWMTPGATRGLLIGAATLLVATLLPAWLRLTLASLALFAGTVMVNLAPESPYRLVALALWQQGHFLNFNGLTRLVSVLWPFLALPYLTLLSRRVPASAAGS